MNNNTCASDLIEQLDKNRSKTDIEDINIILGKIKLFDSKIGAALPQSIKNQKVDVTQRFFTLIELFSELIEKSILPQNQNRVLFAYFLSLHHYAVDLYCPGISHTDAEFTSLWKNFSWIFKMLQPYLFPNDYNSIIEQINREFIPLRIRYDEDQSAKEICESLRKFNSLINELQDPDTSSENFNKAFKELKTLKELFRQFCQKINLFPPHLFNALSLTESILFRGSLFVNICDTIKWIDLKVQESSIISILSIKSIKDNLMHRKFLNMSIKIHQVETRLIYDKIIDINNVNLSQSSNNLAPQDIHKIAHAFYMSTTILLNFSSVLSIRLDSQLMHHWECYIQNPDSYLSLIDQPLNLLFQKSSSSNRTAGQKGFIKNRNNEHQNLINLKNEISLDQNPSIFPYYEEFIRLYNFVANDHNPRSIHPLSHCIILLLKIMNETENDSIKSASTKVIDDICFHLFIAKAREDTIHFEYIIKKILDQKKMIQIKLQQNQISASNSNSNLNNDSNMKSSTNSQRYLTFNPKTNDSPYQTLISLCAYTREFLSTISENRIKIHKEEATILTNYSNYLELLVAVSAPKRNGNNVDGSIPVEYLKYHLSPELISKCLKKFFSDIINEKLPFTATVPPVIFSSYQTQNGKLDPLDMQHIAFLLLTERWKEYDAQYIITRYVKMVFYMDQVNNFLDFCYSNSAYESKLTFDVSENQKLMTLVNNLIKLRKEKSIFNAEESREMAENIFPLLLKAMYKRAIMKVRIEDIIYKIIKNFYVPRCPDLIKNCYLIMGSIDNIAKKNPSLKFLMNELKRLMLIVFSGSTDFHMYNQTLIKVAILRVNNELKNNAPSRYEESKSCLDDFERFMVLCKLLDLISEAFKEYKTGRHGIKKVNQTDGDHPFSQDQDKNDEQQRLEDKNGQNDENRNFDDDDYDDVQNNDDEQSEDDPRNGSQNKNDNDEKENESRQPSNDPYKIPYVSILTKVNHITLMRQKFIDGKKLNLFASSNPDDQLDEFCSSLIKEIDEALATNKFYYIIDSKLDVIIKKFTKQFNFSILLKNLIYYFEELAVYLKNVNGMSAALELVSDKKLIMIKTQLNESTNDIQCASERILNTCYMAKELLANSIAKTMEFYMAQHMISNYIERAQNVLYLLLLKKYPMNIDLMQQTGSVMTQPFPASYATNLLLQQPSQTSNPQFQYILYPQSTKPVALQIPKYQQQKLLNQIPKKLQLVQFQNPPGINYPNYKIVFHPGANKNTAPICISQPIQPQVMQPLAAAAATTATTTVNVASVESSNRLFQKLIIIANILEKLPPSKTVVLAIEKCKDMINGNNFSRWYNYLYSVTPEKASQFQYNELKSINSSLKANICKLEASVKKENIISLNEHFERCLRLVDDQVRKKDDHIQRLNETIENLEEELREIKNQMSREETAPPEVISALDSILDDDILSNIIGQTSLSAAENGPIKGLASSADLNINNNGDAGMNNNNSNGGSRRKNKHRGKYSTSNDDNKDDQKEEQSSSDSYSSSELNTSISSSSIEKVKTFGKKPSSASVLNSLLLQVKNAEILNQRLRRKVERLRFPSSSTPLSSEQFTAAYPLNLDTYEGCSWIANNIKESSSNRNELSKLQDERNNLFEQMVRENASKSMPMKPDQIEKLYENIISACSSAHSNNSSNGKVSKSTFLSFIEKSDCLFTYLDYDINAMKKKLKMLNKQNRMTPTEYVSQFTKRLQTLE